eukprot:scpid9900/ scgid24234/ Lysine-specific demethylase 5A; Histone demethylase JARID1A; Jumonji/ARID domain-containing protein 1A; Retinoblastoma-binding protein 2
MSRSRREEFMPPPKAPVFEPSEEEFRDPLAYINKIRPAAERVGICKIRPPKNWAPPFAVDLESFRFAPRVQRLNELEAHSRVKMNFLSALSKFWELQGTTLKQPHIEGYPLDLHELWKVVLEEGGYEHVMVAKKWSQVARKMGYKKLQHTCFSLRQHFEKILYPYCVFRAVEMSEVKESCTRKTTGYATSAMSTHSLASTQRHKTLRSSDAPEHILLDENNKATNASEAAVAGYAQDKPAICKVCDKRGDKDRLLVCDNCLTCIHTFCLITPLASMPTGGWQCPSCIAAECSKKQESYGFEESKQAYSLETFGEMANRYKCQYFQVSSQPQQIRPELVEKEFWRLVESSDDQVVVQYGADLHSSKHGSGFPFGNRVFTDEDISYSESPWNLNNLPNLESSVLRHVTADISGMKVPWLYVGMCFSSFCWHNEDHWSYSINYLHWGEPKTWYGVPGHCAEKFEKVMESAVPELFRDHPDLLHHLVTLVSPTLLMKNRVPVVSTHQCAGEFVVTFPRAYHAGFNQGFNFAEAVNFCPADWIRIGRSCVDHYRQMRRYTVFSHDELICRMALSLPSMDLHIAEAIDGDLAVLLQRETELRDTVVKAGITEEECESFELLPDDERQCSHCLGLCFLSGVSCKCRSDRLVCLFHINELCSCPMPDKCLRYRYSLDEIRSMKARVAAKAQTYVKWCREVEQLLDAEGDDRPTIADLKRLSAEAENGNLSAPDLVEELKLAIEEAEECAVDAMQLVKGKDTGSSDSMQHNVTVDELERFTKRLNCLPCRIDEGVLVQNLLQRVQSFQASLQSAVADPSPPYSRLATLLEDAKSFDVEVPQLACIQQKLRQAKWLESARVMVARNSEPESTLEQVEELIADGHQHLPHNGVQEALRHLEGLVKMAKQWELRAKALVEDKPTMSHLQSLLSEVDHLPINIPSRASLKGALTDALQWSKEAIAIQDSDISPDLEKLEVLLNRARTIPVQLEQLAQVESLVAAAQGWRDRACRAFLKKSITNSCTLLQVLYPRLDLPSRLRQESKCTPPNLVSSSRAMPLDEETVLLSRLSREEVDEMRQLRGAHIAAAQQSLASIEQGDAPVDRHCVCHNAMSSSMLMCELCLEWFHSVCVHLPRSKLPSASSNTTTSSTSTGGASSTSGSAGGEQQPAPGTPTLTLKENKFICQTCVRSRRPRLDSVLSLLVSLRKVPVQLVENAALQSLTERAMHWQELARAALTEAAAMLERQNPAAIASLLNSLQAPSSSSSVMQSASTPAALSSNGSGSSASGSGMSGLSAAAFISRSQPLPPGLVAAATQAAPCKSQLRSTAPLGRPSSSSSQTGQVQAAAAASLIKTPSVPLPVPRPLSAVSVDDPVGLRSLLAALGSADVDATPPRVVPGEVDLPANVRGHLEALLLEGDLLEVSMDETQQLWQLLHLCSSTKDSVMVVATLMDDNLKDERRRKKKRRHEDEMESNAGSTVADGSSSGPAPTPVLLHASSSSTAGVLSSSSSIQVSSEAAPSLKDLAAGCVLPLAGSSGTAALHNNGGQDAKKKRCSAPGESPHGNHEAVAMDAGSPPTSALALSALVTSANSDA